MGWRKINWGDSAIEADDFIGGSRVRLTYADGNVVIGKLSIEPGSHRAGRDVVMARIITPHSGDTWMNVASADVEVWQSDAWPHDCESCETCGVHDGRHDNCCGCCDGVCCQKSREPNQQNRSEGT